MWWRCTEGERLHKGPVVCLHHSGSTRQGQSGQKPYDQFTFSLMFPGLG